jgi:hypothetical protein
VAGGFSSGQELDSIETLQLSSTATATSSGPAWSFQTGKLPSPRKGLGGVTLKNVFYVCGGDDGTGLNTILYRRDESSDDWANAGNMAFARTYPAVAAIPSTALLEWCD